MKKNDLKGILLGIFLSLVVGATSSCGLISRINAPIYNPYPNELRRILNLHYERGVFDCTHKSVMLQDFYEKKREKARVDSGYLYGTPEEYETNWYLATIPKEKDNHAWVKIWNEKLKKWFLLDPTLVGEKNGFEAKDYVINREPWFTYKEDATPEDIKKGHKVEKVYWENIPKEYFEKIKNKYSNLYEKDFASH